MVLSKAGGLVFVLSFSLLPERDQFHKVKHK